MPLIMIKADSQMYNQMPYISCAQEPLKQQHACVQKIELTQLVFSTKMFTYLQIHHDDSLYLCQTQLLTSLIW